ncbi:hypothetical protein P3342_012161 [Pyrenophora teres f. teres]|nr:hypothetical protein P3342_012161 [Pyrenophora teres f. teres]
MYTGEESEQRGIIIGKSVIPCPPTADGSITQSILTCYTYTACIISSESSDKWPWPCACCHSGEVVVVVVVKKEASQKPVPSASHRVIVILVAHTSIAEMTPSQARRSPCARRNTVAMDEHQGSSSSEESSSGDETSSDITLHEIDEINECLSCSPRVEPVAEAPISQSPEIDPRYIFPFHLISGCSSADRGAVMCTLTSQQVATAVLGLRAAPPHHDTPVETKGTENAGPSAVPTPAQAHRMKHDKSILALAVSSRYILPVHKVARSWYTASTRMSAGASFTPTRAAYSACAFRRTGIGSSQPPQIP